MRLKKVYYWIKLKKDFYDNEKIDYLMSLDNGCAYVVIYQMLLLKAINSNGILATYINDILVPFDLDKIKRECKYFDIDTIRTALALFIKLEMVYQAQILNDSYVIKDFYENIGHETNYSIQKAKERENKRIVDNSKVLKND